LIFFSANFLPHRKEKICGWKVLLVKTIYKRAVASYAAALLFCALQSFLLIARARAI